ncbi:hypothetical protein D9613_012039 [Agrocybe pediades]|uniref:Uncharacterized protein n=1 Tax=Agrocybe pediades TaxID=84607 RepID=A0A8H4QFI4_9AGAR|nr:hypothetical protein D9613_012039 [Agrocybe pediades]
MAVDAADDGRTKKMKVEVAPRKLKTARESVIELYTSDSSSSSSASDSSDSDVKARKSTTRKRKRTKKKRATETSKGEIKVTKKQTVQAVKHLTDIPTDTRIMQIALGVTYQPYDTRSSLRPSSPVNRSSSPAFPPPTSPVNPSSDDYPQAASPLPVEMMEENLRNLPLAVDDNPVPNQGWEEGQANHFTVRNDPMFENLSWVDFPTMTDEDWWMANEDLLENLANNHPDYTATYDW